MTSGAQLPLGRVPARDPAWVLTAGTPHRLAGAIIADEATRF